MIVVSNPTFVADFVKDRLQMEWSGDARGALFVPERFAGSVASKDHVGVAIVWSNFVGRTCQISIVVQHKECLTRAVVREAFRFPFEECGCVAVIAAVESTNLDSLELCRRSGFKQIHRIEGGAVNGDMIFLQALHSECRWLRKVH